MNLSDRLRIGTILASATLTVMAGSIIAPVLNPMEAGLGVSAGATRLIITTHGIVIAILSPFVGIIIDKIGIRKPFVFGLTMYAIAGGSGFFISDYWLLIVSRILFGVGVAAIFTSVTVAILNLYKGPNRNRIMGWRGSSNSIGGIIYPLLGGFLGTITWHLPFTIYLIGLPVALLAYLTLPDMSLKLDDSNNGNGERVSVLQLLKSTPALYFAYGMIFLANLLIYAKVVFLPGLIAQIEPVDTFVIGICFATSSLFAAVTAFFYGRIKAFLSYKAIFIVCLALWIVGFGALSQASSLWQVLCSISLFGIGQGMVIPSVALWAGELIPDSFRGRVTSYLATFGYVGQFLSPILFNPVASALNVNSVFWVVSIVCAVFLLVLLMFLRQ
ncbi:MFS transporter [Chloroflexota bacterium]